jgi:hypothetical protein
MQKPSDSEKIASKVLLGTVQEADAVLKTVLCFNQVYQKDSEQREKYFSNQPKKILDKNFVAYFTILSIQRIVL